MAPTPTQHTDTEAPDSSEMIGREVAGRYRIISKLGEGGMGAVYRAEQMSLKRKVALKVLKPEISASPGLVRRFNAEAELAAKLNHPNTVTLYDFGQDSEGALFIAMEFISGKSLRELLIREGALPTARIAAIGAQISSSLSDAHATGIVHRDLKPDNVMLSTRAKKSDAVTVVDFGIAKLREEEGKIDAQPMTRAGDMLGTPQYMAPEQIRGDKVDARTDVYALGVILYEMATARLPFDGHTVMALLSKHLTEAPIPPHERRPDLDINPALEALIMSCLAKSPDHRPPSMDAVEEELLLLAPPPGSGVSRLAKDPSGNAPIDPAMRSLSPVPMQHTPLSARAPQGSHTGAAPSAIQVRPRPKRAPRTGLWMLLGLLLVGAGGAGVYYASLGDGEAEEGSSNAGDFMAEWTKEAEPGPEEVAPTPTEEVAEPGAAVSNDVDALFYSADNVFVESSFGYRVDLPATFTFQGGEDGEATFTGFAMGEAMVIFTTAWSEIGHYSKLDTEAKLDELFELLEFSTVTRRWRGKGKERTLFGRARDIQAGNEGDFIFLRRGATFYFAAIGNSDGKYGRAKGFRKRFLKNHFHAAGN